MTSSELFEKYKHIKTEKLVSLTKKLEELSKRKEQKNEQRGSK